ncbi:Uncharacterised protein [Mycobacteroides abscessus subsp. abscessus]|nr:Uncharacterised protein [Mycobacteroides abscessus subsp. abscessus]
MEAGGRVATELQHHRRGLTAYAAGTRATNTAPTGPGSSTPGATLPSTTSLWRSRALFRIWDVASQTLVVVDNYGDDTPLEEPDPCPL